MSHAACQDSLNAKEQKQHWSRSHTWKGPFHTMCRYIGRFQILDASLDCKLTIGPTPMSDLTLEVMRSDLAYSISIMSTWRQKQRRQEQRQQESGRLGDEQETLGASSDSIPTRICTACFAWPCCSYPGIDRQTHTSHTLMCRLMRYRMWKYQFTERFSTRADKNMANASANETPEGGGRTRRVNAKWANRGMEGRELTASGCVQVGTCADKTCCC